MSTAGRTACRLAGLGWVLVAGPPLAAQQAPPFILGLPASVRSAGMAGAGVAVIGDAGALFRNPAGLATIKYLSVEGAYHRYPDRTAHAAGALAVRLRQLNLGFGASYLRFSDTASVRENIAGVGTLVYRYALFALGASAKYLQVEDSAGALRRAGTADLGLAIAIFDISALGFSVQNIVNERISGARLALPTSYRLGFMLNFVDPQTAARLLGTIEQVWTDGAPGRTLAALEAGVVVSGVGLVARIGYGGQPAGSNQNRLAYGGSVVLGRLGLDYAYQKRSGLGGRVHRVGLRWTP